MLSLWGAVTVPLCLQYQIGVVLVGAGQTSAQSIMSVCWPQQSCDLVMWHVWYISVWVTGAAQCMVCIVIGAGRHWPQYIPLTLNLLFLKRNLMPLKTSLGYTRPFRYSFMLYGDIFGEFLVAAIWSRCVYCTMSCVIDWGLQKVNISLVQEGQKLGHHLGYWSPCLTLRSWLCVRHCNQPPRRALAGRSATDRWLFIAVWIHLLRILSHRLLKCFICS